MKSFRTAAFAAMLLVTSSVSQAAINRPVGFDQEPLALTDMSGLSLSIQGASLGVVVLEWELPAGCESEGPGCTAFVRDSVPAIKAEMVALRGAELVAGKTFTFPTQAFDSSTVMRIRNSTGIQPRNRIVANEVFTTELGAPFADGATPVYVRIR